MKRQLSALAAAAVLLAVLAAGNALGMSNGGGNSSNAPGQARAEEQCMNVWGNVQATLVAGGGPKTSILTGPTNCDHFWQSEGVIGNPNA